MITKNWTLKPELVKVGEKYYCDRVIVYEEGYPIAILPVDHFWKPKANTQDSIYGHLNAGNDIVVSVDFSLKNVLIKTR